MARKPYIVKKGKFLVGATYPLHYKTLPKPLRKTRESLERVAKRSHLTTTFLHEDKEGKFKLIGEVGDFSLEDKMLDGEKETELYSGEIKLFRGGLLTLPKGVYGLSLDFQTDPMSIKDSVLGGDDVIDLPDDGTEYPTVALVPSPRHSVRDVDLSDLRNDMVRSLYDSSVDDLQRIEDIPVLLVGGDTIALQDSVSCDILDIKEPFVDSKADIKQLVESFANKISSVFGGSEVGKGTHKNEELNMDRKELEEVLDKKFADALGEQFDAKLKETLVDTNLKLQDSADTMSSKVEELVNRLESFLSPATEKTETVGEEGAVQEDELTKLKKELEVLRAEALSTKEENAKLKEEVSEKERLVQTMGVTAERVSAGASEESLATTFKGSDSSDKSDLSFLDKMNTLEMYRNGNK